MYTREQWAQLTVDERGPCKEWVKASCGKGYGIRRRVNLESALVHRQSWVEAYGPIPVETPWVLHHCDNPPCYRVDHLFLGTHADNMRDMKDKGRGVNPRYEGERHPRALLTNDLVREIRDRYFGPGVKSRRGLNGVTQLQLAVEYGVSRQQISNVLTHHNWSPDE